MGKLPETLALLGLVLVIVLMTGPMAMTVRSFDAYRLDSPFQQRFSLEFRRELAENPPALGRDLRMAGPARFAFLGLGALLAVVAVRALRRPSAGAAAARGIALLALLLTVVLVVPIWGSRTGWDLVSEFWRVEGAYPRLAPVLALVRVGLAVAIAGHALALMLGFVTARRAAR